MVLHNSSVLVKDEMEITMMKELGLHGRVNTKVFRKKSRFSVLWWPHLCYCKANIENALPNHTSTFYSLSKSLITLTVQTGVEV